MSALTAQLVRQAREILGLSREQLAIDLGISASQVQRYEFDPAAKGHGAPPGDVLADLLQRAGLLHQPLK